MRRTSIKSNASFKQSFMKEFFAMAHVNQTSDSNAQHTFIKEIETMLSSQDGISIFVCAWIPDNPQRVLVCVQGLGGHGGYYQELAYQLAFENTIVVAPDLRGYGLSEGMRGDVNGFNHYLADVDSAVTWASATWP